MGVSWLVFELVLSIIAALCAFTTLLFSVEERVRLMWAPPGRPSDGQLGHGGDLFASTDSVADMRATLTDNSSRIGTLDGTLRTAGDNWRVEETRLSSKVGGLAAQVTILDEKREVLEGDVGGWKSRLGASEAKREADKAEMRAFLKAAVEAERKRSADRIADLEAKFETKRDQLAATVVHLKSDVEKNSDRTKESSGELSAKVSALQQQVGMIKSCECRNHVEGGVAARISPPMSGHPEVPDGAGHSVCVGKGGGSEGGTPTAETSPGTGGAGHSVPEGKGSSTAGGEVEQSASIVATNSSGRTTGGKRKGKAASPPKYPNSRALW
ncbi:hypothetical protein B0A50_04348 [Salinomyces thailandicus]|uniref:Uncharacterized protein n=1 Tax=Salinomyces thailandicus TaxID=706561 RepID=A0A4U0TYG7_9PEZI|nr:hypothetical protein B0A50_04348 [Salinomyces thailandica]